MRFSVIIASHGNLRWRRLALERARPSVRSQADVFEILAYHAPGTSTVAAVRNAVAEVARGDWLIFLDADDELGLGYVKAMRDTAKWTGPALLVPRVQYVYGRREDKPVKLGHGKPLIELNRAVIGSAVPRSLFLELGGFGDEPIYEDWALWLRVSERVPLVDVEKAVYRVHVAPNGRNGAPRQLSREWYRRIRERHEAVDLSAPA